MKAGDGKDKEKEDGKVKDKEKTPAKTPAPDLAREVKGRSVFFSRLAHAFKLGLRSLAAHRLRSGLTTLGIVLGVASVIVMLAVGEAARYQALKQLEDLGANTILLRSVKPTDDPSNTQGVDMPAYGLTYADLDRIRATIPTVAAATPMREYRKTVRHTRPQARGPGRRRHPGVLQAAQHPAGAAAGGSRRPTRRRYDNVAVLGVGHRRDAVPGPGPDRQDGHRSTTRIGRSRSPWSA